MIKPYPAYKDSGIEWIGKIPENWNIMRLGLLGVFTSSGIDKKINEDEEPVKMVNFMNVYNNNYYILNNEINFMKVSCPKAKAKEHQVRKGDLLFLPSSETQVDLGASALVDEELPNTVFSYHLARLQFVYKIYHSYKKYLCNNYFVLNQFSKNGKGTTRQILGRNVFRNIKILLPSVSEQKQVALYLDYKTRFIDDLIEKTSQKIELLKEKRTSLINHCVTKGLNPDAEMKDSGIEWIGEIPINWKITRIGYEASVIDPQPDHRAPKLSNNGYPYIGIRDINDNGYVNLKTCRYVELKAIEKQEQSFKIDDNDLIFCKVGTLGFSRFFKKPDVRFALSATLVIIKVNNNNDPRYINYSLLSNYIFNQISYESTGSTRKALGIEVIRDFKIVIPGIKAQEKISNFLDSQTQKIDTLIEKENKRIELLKEYRQSLISEAVTGKIDVRDEVIA